MSLSKDKDMSKLAFLTIAALIAVLTLAAVFVSAYASPGDGSDAANKSLESGKKLETSLSITHYQWTNQTKTNNHNYRHSIITTTMEYPKNP
jgi:hypothetical protein